MKLTKSFVGCSSAMMGALLVVAVLRFTSWGGENEPAFKVSAAPINRDARFGKERPMPMNPFFRQFFGDQFPSNDRERTRKEQNLGSGVIVSADGYILTANHVVAEADEIKVFIGDNKKEFTARVIGKDQATDVAVLKIEANNLPAVTLADSDQLEIGDIVLALGNPFGVGQSVTMGIVSGLGRSGLPGFNQYQDFIQTDAAINPGNSGGALVDGEGRLVGINTAIFSRSGGSMGIGFAIPVDIAREVMDALIRDGQMTRGWIGVQPRDLTPEFADSCQLPVREGVLVTGVLRDGPAAQAGLKPGDVGTAIG